MGDMSLLRYFAPAHPVSIATFNTRAGLGNSAEQKPKMAKLKRAAIREVISKSAISCFQELRGDYASLLAFFGTLRRTYVIAYSYGPSARAGGVAIVIDRAWLGAHYHIKVDNLWAGRAIGVTIRTDHGSFRVHFYLPVETLRTTMKSLLTRCIHYTSPSHDAQAFLAADFNFLENGEAPMKFKEGEDQLYHYGVWAQRIFDEHAQELMELDQPDPTHKAAYIPTPGCRGFTHR